MDKELEKSFLDQLYESQTLLHKICSLYTNNDDAHKELFQEITVQLWRAYPSFKGDSKFSTWAYRVGLNTAMALHRKTAKSYAVSFDTDKHIVRDEDYNYEVEEYIKLLYRAIHEKLNDVEKALVFMYLEEKEYEEIAETLGITEGNARLRLMRVKDKLKKILNP
ncbi:RNA polymerase sigma factor [Flavobacterium sp. RHBU_3]|uniref:RNA polymerase sigma factor n=1 Tax=Flavobacterium sp. RHBU_3 TaxID=3391184 RepID=UPI00398520F8